jgi:hypothetical protein
MSKITSSSQRCICCRQQIERKPIFPTGIPFGYVEAAILRELISVFPEGLTCPQLLERIYNGNEEPENSGRSFRVVLFNVRKKLAKKSSNISISSIFSGKPPACFYITFNK